MHDGDVAQLQRGAGTNQDQRQALLRVDAGWQHQLVAIAIEDTLCRPGRVRQEPAQR